MALTEAEISFLSLKTLLGGTSPQTPCTRIERLFCGLVVQLQKIAVAGLVNQLEDRADFGLP